MSPIFKQTHHIFSLPTRPPQRELIRRKSTDRPTVVPLAVSPPPHHLRPDRRRCRRRSPEMENEHCAADNEPPKNAILVEGNSIVNSVKSTANSSGSHKESGEGVKSQVLAVKLPSEIYVYRQDVVTCQKYEGALGVVTEVAGDADSEGSITDDSDSDDDGNGNGNGNSENCDDGDDANGDGDGNGGNENGNVDGGEVYDSIPDGQVRIIWTDGSETAENINDVAVVDRGFLPGDIVASASDPTGQLGLVVDVNITIDLLGANKEVIKNVSSKDLKRVREPLVGDYVVLGPWLGRVDDVLDNVTVLFDDGSICKVVKADPLRLKPLLRPVADDESCPFYPGQRVRGASSSVFKNSKWLFGSWKANRLEGTIIKVQAASVIVYWISSAHFGSGTNSNAPSEEQDPKNLTLLSCFSYANWQLGDWCHLSSRPLTSSSFSEESKNRKELSEGSRCHIKHSEECSLGEHVDINSSMEDSDHALDGPRSLLGGQASEMSNQGTAGQDQTFKSTHMIMSGDVHDPTIVCGHQRDSCNENSSRMKDLEGKHQPRCSDSTGLNGMNKVGESSKPESNIVLPECGSCSSTSSVSKEPTHESGPAYRKKLRKFSLKRDKPRRRGNAFERALFVVHIETKVDVAWQDGTKGYGLASKSLIPISTPSDHEFFPEQYVMDNASTEGDESSATDRVGVVKNVNSKERTVCVRWIKPASSPEEPREFDCDEIVSAYELAEHPDYDYCYGDVVVRLSPVSVCAVTADSGSPVEQLEQHSSPVEAEANGSTKPSDDDEVEPSDDDEVEQAAEGEVCEEFTSLSWVGNITGLQDGDIEVTWADGMVSKVGPQAIFVVGREDDVGSFDGGSDITDDGASWETVDDNETDKFDEAGQEAVKQDPIVNIVETENQNAILPEDNNAGRLSMPLAALSFVSRLATGLFSRDKKHPDQSGTENIDVHNKETVIVDVSDGNEAKGELKCEESNDVNNLSEQNASGSATRHTDMAMSEDEEMMNSPTPMEKSVGADNKDSCSFKHFDIAENPLDHHYIASTQSSGERKWVKKVQKDWSILEKNLPDAIYVRVFEDRMDLLRAVIVGASGTPYQDGLFFFDFHLPPEYPQVPPSAYYHSGGLRVNPNLYVDGKVCLSLLNTWTGRGNEVWDPSSSSILQVLVSLQGLVLNSKPYFNEAGYEKQVGTVEGEKNALPYNENTYLLNLKSMLFLLRRPPMHFEGFVKDHFRGRGHYILEACKAYMEGCMIGSLTKDACMTEKSREHPCSVGFKLMLAKILPRLISALTEAGVDCHQFEHLQRAENLALS